MKKTIVLMTTAIMLFAAGCGPSQKITSTWVKPDRPQKQYSKVFIAVMLQNTQLKMKLEEQLAQAATAKGLQVVKSGDVFPPNFSKDNMPDKQVVLDKIKEKGCDAIFTVAIIDKQSETRYVPGTATYMPYVGYGYGFRGYYGFWGPTMYSPGYYTTDKTYFFEANTFDVESEAMIASVQSEAYNPSSIEKFSKEYTAMLVEHFKAGK